MIGNTSRNASNMPDLLINISLRLKLLITYLLIGLLPLVILFFISYSIISNSLENKALYGINQSFSQAKQILEKRTQYMIDLSNLISLNESVQEILTRDIKSYENDIIAQNTDYINLNKYLNSFGNINQVYHMSIYMTNGPFYTTERSRFYGLSDASEEGWLERIAADKSRLIWFASSSSKKSTANTNPVISAIRKINSSRSYNEYSGYLKLDILESEIRDLLKASCSTRNTKAFLINSRYEIICTSSIMEDNTDNLISISKRFANAPDSNSSSKIQQYKYNDDIIMTSVIHLSDWKLISITPRSEIIYESIKIRDYIFWLLLAVILLTLFFSYLVSGTITRRLFMLTNRMRQTGKGIFDMEVLPSNKDEVGFLIQNFNYMLTKIAMHADEKYEMGKEIKSAELKALQAQINPHFLYNTLDLINWIAVENNVPQISLLVKSMSKFYKLTLSKGQDIVPLKNELEHIKEYVYIQNIRFDNQIKLVIDVPDELMDINVLKLTLQPIVENSIFHGILKKDIQDGTIKISCITESTDLIMTISDDGIGIPPDKLDGILIDSSTDTSQSYGVKNIHNRYKVFFGEKYGLSYKSTNEVGTTVELRLPIK